MTMKITWCPL